MSGSSKRYCVSREIILPAVLAMASRVVPTERDTLISLRAERETKVLVKAPKSLPTASANAPSKVRRELTWPEIGDTLLRLRALCGESHDACTICAAVRTIEQLRCELEWRRSHDGQDFAIDISGDI